MKILDISPRDIFVTFEISVGELKCLVDALDHAEFKYNGEDNENLKFSVQYMVKQFYPELVKVLKQLESENGG